MLLGNRGEIADQLRGALKDAGSLLVAVAVIASLALGLAAGACYMAFHALRAARAA